MHSQAPAEPYVTDFETTVERIDGTEVVLEETYFYPQGGGQPADRGRIGECAVVDVQHGPGAGVVHELATEPSFARGESVLGVVDPDFRTFCMRAHTASHALYGAGRRLLDDLGYGGFDIAAEREDRSDSPGGKVRVDFATSTDVDDGTLVELERLVNRVVWDSHDVTWETVEKSAALDREDVAFNTKTEEGITGDTVRLVTIEDWDVAACGGTHVRNTREIGPVTVLDRSNPGEGLTRVEFTVGPDAIERRADERRQAGTAARQLDTRIVDLPAAVDRLESERDDLAAEVEQLREQVVEARLSELREQVVEREGHEWLVGDVTSLDANDLADLAQSLAGTAADVIVLVGPEAEYLAIASACELGASDLVDRATDRFGGGGGGSPSVAQAGGLQCDVEELVALYRDGA